MGSWLLVRGTSPGPLFTSMRPGLTSLEPISGNAVARIVQNRAKAAGLSAERITGHSLRAGHATRAAMAGVAIDLQPRPRALTRSSTSFRVSR